MRIDVATNPITWSKEIQSEVLNFTKNDTCVAAKGSPKGIAFSDYVMAADSGTLTAIFEIRNGNFLTMVNHQQFFTWDF